MLIILKKIRKTEILKKKYEIQTCSICLENFEDGEELSMTPLCNHTFHLICLE